MEGIVIWDSTLHSVYSKLNQTLKGRLEAASNFMPASNFLPASNFVFAFALLSLWLQAGKYPKVWSPQSRKSKLVLFPICLVFNFFSYVYWLIDRYGDVKMVKPSLPFFSLVKVVHAPPLVIKHVYSIHVNCIFAFISQRINGKKIKGRFKENI